MKLEAPESLEMVRAFLQEDARIDAHVESERVLYSSSLVSTMIESVVLALAGGGIGALLA